MKIGGVDPKTLSKEEILVLPRGDQEVVFRAVGLPDYDEFNKLCPEPKPPGKLTKHGWEPNEKDEGYQSIVAAHNAKFLSWLVIKSLEPSDIEWDTVDPAKPSTWTRWRKDLKEAGFNHVECNRIQTLVIQANCLDEDKLAQAREVFLLGQQPEQKEYSGPNTGPQNTPFGEPASE